MRMIRNDYKKQQQQKHAIKITMWIKSKLCMAWGANGCFKEKLGWVIKKNKKKFQKFKLFFNDGNALMLHLRPIGKGTKGGKKKIKIFIMTVFGVTCKNETTKKEIQPTQWHSLDCLETELQSNHAF